MYHLSKPTCSARCGRSVLSGTQTVCDYCFHFRRIEDDTSFWLTHHNSDSEDNAQLQDKNKKAPSSNYTSQSKDDLRSPERSTSTSSIFYKISRMTSNFTQKSIGQTPARKLMAAFMRVFNSSSNRQIQDMFVCFVTQMNTTKSIHSVKQAHLYHEFISKTMLILLSRNDFMRAVENPDKLRFCIERLLTFKLHSHLIQTIIDEENADLLFNFKVRNHRWVNETHLHIKCRIYEDPKLAISFLAAQSYLHRLRRCFSPVDKIKCVLKCCKELFVVLHEMKVGGPVSADDFFPLLIFCILQANPPNVKAHTLYISRFVHDSFLNKGETAYYFTSFEGAIHHIDSWNCSSFKIPAEEYESLMNQHKSIVELNIESAIKRLEAIEKSLKDIRQRLREAETV